MIFPKKKTRNNNIIGTYFSLELVSDPFYLQTKLPTIEHVHKETDSQTLLALTHKCHYTYIERM